MSKSMRYVAFLRGINVGGSHKVPMADLRKEMSNLGYKNVNTLLNSGNVIFDASTGAVQNLAENISNHLEQVFGFRVPVLVRSAENIFNLIDHDPFKQIELTNDLRFYVSFLQENPKVEITLPWSAEDESFRILEIRDKVICSVLDLSVTKTTKGMKLLEHMFGKNLTTRNWNTVLKLGNKI
ncbi:MAG: DUF1697 domain-containing protein [Balneolaceae bacterium]